MATSLNVTSPLSPTGQPRQGTRTYSYGGFTLPSSASSSTPSSLHDANGDSIDAPLPFPTALARADFLTPNFDAVDYLSRLHSSGSGISGTRHQTLEDLRAELRERSAAISAELLELVNVNYASFLGLGDELKGGEERVEDVRVGLLGFKRAVQEIKGRAAEKSAEVTAGCDELQAVRGGIELGRRLLELDERVAGLEQQLLVGSLGSSKGTGHDAGFNDIEDDEGEDEDVDEEDLADSQAFVSSSPAKLAALAREYSLVEHLADSIGREIPFVRKVEGRMARCRNTILLDLGTALSEARKVGPRGEKRTLRFLAIYQALNARAEAVRVLKER